MHPSILISGGTPLYRAGLVELLQLWWPDSQVHTTVDGQPEQSFDLYLLILLRTSRTGVAEVHQRFLDRGPSLLLGGYLSHRRYGRLCKRGLCAYLLHTASAKQLLTAIENVLNGETYLDPNLTAAWQRGTTPAPPRGLLFPLTRREREVLELIVGEYTTDEIAGKLYISRCTVETHRSHILQKLGVRNTAGLVREALRHELCDA
jgi:DNA-binding NarL/FixJ family response regulator